jgi:hypothetical protein
MLMYHLLQFKFVLRCTSTFYVLACLTKCKVCLFGGQPMDLLPPILHEDCTCDFDHMIQIFAGGYDDSTFQRLEYW